MTNPEKARSETANFDGNKEVAKIVTGAAMSYSGMMGAELLRTNGSEDAITAVYVEDVRVPVPDLEISSLVVSGLGMAMVASAAIRLLRDTRRPLK